MEPFISCLIGIVVNAICIGIVLGINIDNHDPVPLNLKIFLITYNLSAIIVNIWCIVKFINILRP